MAAKGNPKGASTPPQIRTGIRLLENLAMPAVHVVEQGNTLYSVARLHDVPTSCLSELNGVWDHLQPGMVLRIPAP
jgi:LysM repeat protein